MLLLFYLACYLLTHMHTRITYTQEESQTDPEAETIDEEAFKRKYLIGMCKELSVLSKIFNYYS